MLFVDEFCGILVYIKFGADVTSQYERNIIRFDNFDDFFDFIYDENTDKADIINDMSQQMKRQLVSENYGERFIEADGAFYYNSECFTQMALLQSDEEDNAPVYGM